MQIKQYKFKEGEPPAGEKWEEANLVLVFGERELIGGANLYPKLSGIFPKAAIVFCSTAGEIADTAVSDNTIIATAIHFDKSTVSTRLVNIRDFDNSYAAGQHLIESLNKDGLMHVIVFADGQLVNGSELVRGMNNLLPKGVSVSGGLAGDGPRFKKTLVGLNENTGEGNLVALGLYGQSLLVGYGSKGGWDSFGPYRKITRSKANILYELEGKSALELYKHYLGDLASGLPGTALLFPLSLKTEEKNEVVRTILSVSEEDQSMTFAGDMPEGSYARLMKANFDRLIDAASDAASNSFAPFRLHKPELALLVSCVGRKLVLDQRVDEEVESVRHILGPQTVIAGFYSYGEISPLAGSLQSQLHNQTMTITTLSEI